MQETQETWMRSLGWENPLEEDIMTRGAWQAATRSMAGCKEEHGRMQRGAWSRKEAGTTECLSTLQSFYHEFALFSSLVWFMSRLVGFCPCLVFQEGLLSSVSLNSWLRSTPWFVMFWGVTFFYPQNFVDFVSLSSFDECYLGEIWVQTEFPLRWHDLLFLPRFLKYSYFFL